MLTESINQLFPSPALQSDAVFLINNSPDLHALTSCIALRKKNLFLAWLPGISANSIENYRRYNFQAFANISINFRTTSL